MGIVAALRIEPETKIVAKIGKEDTIPVSGMPKMINALVINPMPSVWTAG